MAKNWKFKISTDNWATSRTVYPVPDFDIKIVREGLNSVIEVGDLTFIENSTSDYSYFLSKINAGTTKIPLRVYENGVLLTEKNIDLLTRKHDIYNTRLTFAVVADENDLLQKIIDAKDTEFNLIESSAAGEVDVISKTKVIFIIHVEVTTPPYGFSLGHFANNSTIPEWSNTRTYQSFGYVIADFGTCDSVVRHNGYNWKSLIDNNTSEPVIGGSYWEVIPENIYLHFKRISLDAFEGSSSYNPSFDAEIYREYGDTWDVETILGWGGFGSDFWPDSLYFNRSLYQAPQADYRSLSKTLKHGRLLKNVVKGIFLNISSSILFEENAGANCWCNYLESSANYNDIRIYDNSDVRFPDATYAASFTKMTLSRFLGIMKIAFGLDWQINSSNYIQLIHPSEASFFSEVGTDLSNINGVDFSAMAVKYNMKADKDVRVENFTYAKSGSNYFDQVSISYKAKGTLANKSAGDVTGNVMDLLKGEDSQLDNSGIAWVSVENGDTVRNFNDISNGFMTAEKLFIEHSTYERPYSIGRIDGVTEIELNTSNLNDADEVKCKSLLLKDINILELAKTKLSKVLGITGCRIKSVSENVQSGVQSFELEF